MSKTPKKCPNKKDRLSYPSQKEVSGTIGGSNNLRYSLNSYFILVDGTFKLKIEIDVNILKL